MARRLRRAGRAVAEVPRVAGDRAARAVGEIHRQRRSSDSRVSCELRHRRRCIDRDVVGARLGVAAARTGDRQAHRVGTRRRIDVARRLRRAGRAVAEVPRVAGDRSRRSVREVERQRRRPQSSAGSEAGNRGAVRNSNRDLIRKWALESSRVVGGYRKVIGRSLIETWHRVCGGVADVARRAVVARRGAVMNDVTGDKRGRNCIPRESRGRGGCHDYRAVASYGRAARNRSERPSRENKGKNDPYHCCDSLYDATAGQDALLKMRGTPRGCNRSDACNDGRQSTFPAELRRPLLDWHLQIRRGVAGSDLFRTARAHKCTCHTDHPGVLPTHRGAAFSSTDARPLYTIGIIACLVLSDESRAFASSGVAKALI